MQKTCLGKLLYEEFSSQLPPHSNSKSGAFGYYISPHGAAAFRYKRTVNTGWQRRRVPHGTLLLDTRIPGLSRQQILPADIRKQKKKKR